MSTKARWCNLLCKWISPSHNKPIDHTTTKYHHKIGYKIGPFLGPFLHHILLYFPALLLPHYNHTRSYNYPPYLYHNSHTIYHTPFDHTQHTATDFMEDCRTVNSAVSVVLPCPFPTKGLSRHYSCYSPYNSRTIKSTQFLPFSTQFYILFRRNYTETREKHVKCHFQPF